VRLIVNADDFGRTEAINAAVAQAHSEGILTSASLMVGGSAALDAVRIARDHPQLAVGLHLVLLGGHAVLPPHEIPHLVDDAGFFPRGTMRTALSYFSSPRVRAELAKEVRAQFEAFLATGLPLSHVDGHHHMHLHPLVFRLLLPLASEYGARGIRVSVSDELLFSLRRDRHDLLLKLGWKIVFSLLSRGARRSLRRRPLPAADRVYGLMQSGRLTERYLVRLVARLAGKAGGGGSQARGIRPSVFEVFCHPSQGGESRRLGPNPGDLAALLSPAAHAAVDASGMLLTTYPQAWQPSPHKRSADVTTGRQRQPEHDPTA
jgi:hopanoid biosynthesis associated protein HpnK